MHPLVHAMNDAPNVLVIKALAGTCFRATQHTWVVTHREQRRLPHAVHRIAAVAFVARAEMLGAHAHPIPAGALVWLNAVADGGVTSTTFMSLRDTALSSFICAVNAERNIDKIWFLEACLVVGRYATNTETVHLPSYAVQSKSPQAANRDGIHGCVALAAEGYASGNTNNNERAASLFMYHITLAEIAQRFTVTCGVRRTADTAYALLADPLRKYAHECTFAVTGDRFMHICLRMHLPSWCTMLSTGGCYAELSDMLGASVNNVVRPYVDMNISKYVASRDAAEDDVVLFVIMCTLIAEVAGKQAIKVLYNRDVQFAPPDVACPFVLCDFPVPGIVTDAFGYTLNGTLVVCNGLGTSGAVSLWVSMLGYSVPIVAAYVDGTADTSNPLRKYESG